MEHVKIIAFVCCLPLFMGFPGIGAQHPCRFDLFEPNTPANPIHLSGFSDTAEDRQNLWISKTTGVYVTGTLDDGVGHRLYLGAAHAKPPTNTYYMRGNAKTKRFTRDFQTRLMKRALRLYCDENKIVYVDYHFEISIEDLTPPKFEAEQYTMNITPDWNPLRPISNEHFVIVSDNAYEIQSNEDHLTITTIPPGKLRVEKSRMWSLPNPDQFYYRLDIYLEDNVRLGEGQYTFALTASDKFNSGATDLIINVASK